MKFKSGMEMYNYLQYYDLYSKSKECYVFSYNEAGALCTYNISEKEADDLAKKSVLDSTYWGGFLGPGGSIMEDFDYYKEVNKNPEDSEIHSKYLQPSFDFCNENYDVDDWENTDDYSERVLSEKLNGKEFEQIIKDLGFGEYICHSFEEAEFNNRAKNIVILNDLREHPDVYLTFKYNDQFGELVCWVEDEFEEDNLTYIHSLYWIKDIYSRTDKEIIKRINTDNKMKFDPYITELER